jgi:hypothetical protein
MLMHRLVLLAAMLVCALAGEAATSHAFAAQRDCQTIRTCNFRKGGSYRGCLSSYSCRVCRFVPVSCQGLGGGKCQKLVCTWGGIS